jgi:hypothetical protein
MVTEFIEELFNQKMRFCDGSTVANILLPDYLKNNQLIGIVTHAYALSLVSSLIIKIAILYNVYGLPDF